MKDLYLCHPLKMKRGPITVLRWSEAGPKQTWTWKDGGVVIETDEGQFVLPLSSVKYEHVHPKAAKKP